MGITFGELRKYISQICKLSICKYETQEYQNYICIKDVPEKYNALYVYGVDVIDSEFDLKENSGFAFMTCMEIVLSEEPRRDV